MKLKKYFVLEASSYLEFAAFFFYSPATGTHRRVETKNFSILRESNFNYSNGLPATYMIRLGLGPAEWEAVEGRSGSYSESVRTHADEYCIDFESISGDEHAEEVSTGFW
jgi:hypothetical protein